MIYLASPYAHPAAEIREQRFQAACAAVASLLHVGEVIFSPIVHGHPLLEHGIPEDWTFWEKVDQHYLMCCDEMMVLMLEGWQYSEGVEAEIALALEMGKPIRYLDPNDVEVGPTLARVPS